MIALVFLSLFVLLPAAVFVYLPATVRRSVLAIAVAALLASFLLIGSEPGNPLLIVPVVLGGIALGALLVEAFALVRRLLRKRKAMLNG